MTVAITQAVTRECRTAELTYELMPWDDLTTEVRGDLVVLGDAAALPLDDLASPVARMGKRIAERYAHAAPGHQCGTVRYASGRTVRVCSGPDIGLPVAAYMQRNTYDAPKPTVPCIHALVAFRYRSEGGWLVFDDGLGVECADEWVTLFDGTRPHSVAPSQMYSTRSFHITLTYLLPIT